MRTCKENFNSALCNEANKGLLVERVVHDMMSVSQLWALE